MVRQFPASTSYRVEVSGWDTSEEFFVEKTTLEWNEGLDKVVSVRHALRAGAVVFVRLLDSTSSHHSFPIAYQTQAVEMTESQDLHRVSLVQLRPNPTTSAIDSPAC